MTANQKTKDDLIATLWRMRATLEQLVAEAGPARMEQPGVTDDWSFKDVIGHLNGWRWWSVARMEAAARNREPVPPMGVAFERENEPGTVDELNQQIYRHYHDRPVSEVLRDSRATFDRLEDAIQAISEADLFQPNRYAWLHGYAAADIVGGSAGHLYEEHEPGIRAWLARLDAS